MKMSREPDLSDPDNDLGRGIQSNPSISECVITTLGMHSFQNKEKVTDTDFE